MESAYIAGAVALVLWVANRFYETWDRRRRSRERSIANIRALYAEIDFNTRDMEMFLANPSSKEAIIARLRQDKGFIPHVTDARHTDVYRSRISEIHQFGKGSIGRIIYFYGLLEKIRIQIEGVYLPSFTLISDNGRANVIHTLYATCQECEELGSELLQTLAREHPKLKLERENRIDITAEILQMTQNQQ